MRKALVVGRHYVDISRCSAEPLTGNEKSVTRDWAISYIAGNAVCSAFACSKLGGGVELLSTVGKDELGLILLKRAGQYGIRLHPRYVAETSVSIIKLEGGDRSIERLRRDDLFLEEFRVIDPACFAALHLDGHQPDAAIHYARTFRENGLLTSLDLGTVRENTHELLGFIDVVSASEEVCKPMGAKDPQDLLDLLHAKGGRTCIVTLGKKGLIWCEEDGTKKAMQAIAVRDSEIVDGCNAGDFHNGARIFSYLQDPGKSWHEHLLFASVVASRSLRHMGCENKLRAMQTEENIRASLTHRPIAVSS